MKHGRAERAAPGNKRQRAGRKTGPLEQYDQAVTINGERANRSDAPQPPWPPPDAMDTAAART
ncbi:MAG: hypothetical protein ABI876_17545, partial [Bacteroidota bacterium]